MLFFLLINNIKATSVGILTLLAEKISCSAEPQYILAALLSDAPIFFMSGSS